MGAWGATVFENDAAEDWMGELLEEGDHQPIKQALDAVVEGSIEADECSAALAAAEVVAAARGWPVRGFPKELKDWIEEFDYRPTAEEQSLGIQAVQQVGGESELAELWAENAKEEKQWRAGLEDLTERLKKKLQPRPEKKPPKQSAPSGVKDAIKRLKKLDAYIQTTLMGQVKYVHLTSHVDDETLAACLPHLSKTKVLKIGWGEGTITNHPAQTSDAALESLDQFKALQVLELNCVPITDATLARLKTLTKLRELSLTGTKISDAGMEHLWGLTALESLDLGSTAITSQGVKHLAGLKNLKKLDLFKTAVGDDGLQHLAGLTNLTELDLRYTPITGIALKHLANMTNMWILELDHTLIDDEGVAHLSKMSKLARLTIRGKRITDKALPTIGKLKSLEGLVLEDTRLTDAAIPTLAALPILDIVHLAGTEITTAGAKKLREARPQLSVLEKDA